MWAYASPSWGAQLLGSAAQSSNNLKMCCASLSRVYLGIVAQILRESVSLLLPHLTTIIAFYSLMGTQIPPVYCHLKLPQPEPIGDKG